MPSNQIDIKAQLKAFPYVKPRVVDEEAEAEEEASKIDNFLSDLEELSSLIPTGISGLIGPDADPGASIVGTDEWEGKSAVGFGISQEWIESTESILAPINGALKGLEKIINILSKILRIIELFNSVFASFSKLILSTINFAQNKLNEMAEDLSVGIYANIMAPPALMKKFVGDINVGSQLYGGFNGFLSRLETSIYNTKDENRPMYTAWDQVGGLVIMLDTESIDELWTGLKQLAGMFDFMQLFPINLSPPPPNNLKGFCGYFTKDEKGELSPLSEYGLAEADAAFEEAIGEKKKFGVQIEWDGDFTVPAYAIYRSTISGGRTELVEYVPSYLLDNKEKNEPGLLSVMGDAIANLFSKRHGVYKLPEREERTYDDPDFNPSKGPAKVIGLRPKLKYVDTDISAEKIDPSKPDSPEYVYTQYYWDQKKEEYVKGSQKIPIINYYYTIRSCSLSVAGGENWFGIQGPDSEELTVTIKTCNDSYSMADLIQQKDGQCEFLSAGAGGINNWSSIKISLMIPWFLEVIDILNSILDALKGMCVDTSDSFTVFIKQLVDKVRMYMDILKTVTWLMTSLKSFFLGSSIAMLYLPPSKGGMRVFVDRIRGAKPPEGTESFSGPNGITLGIVLVHGADYALAKALELIVRLLSK